MLMMWDGLGYFGFDDTKLARLRGEQVTWWTPFTSWKTTTLSFVGLAVGIYIIITEAARLGKLKSQAIDLQQSEAFRYNIDEAMPLIGCNWFWNSEVFPRARNYQIQNKGNKNFF
jgi:hypothetical protein